MSDLFTFQYGQIYYREDNAVRRRAYDYLHSNMVRFIIKEGALIDEKQNNLHSNMVRFIIIQIQEINMSKFEFTFQYGQIYYSFGS